MLDFCVAMTIPMLWTISGLIRPWVNLAEPPVIQGDPYLSAPDG